jgi:hypothetical protein
MGFPQGSAILFWQSLTAIPSSNSTFCFGATRPSMPWSASPCSSETRPGIGIPGCTSFKTTRPLTASHHQKVVAVDGRIAFCGGLDLSKWRWDTSEHLADDGRRSDPHGKPHPPFHPLRVQHAGTARDPRPAYTPAGGYDLRIVSSALTIVPEAIVTCSRRPETGWHFGGY